MLAHSMEVPPPPPPVHINNVQLSRKCQESQAATWQETYLSQAHYHKMETTRNHPHQNVSHNAPQETNFSYIKQYSNQSGLGIQLWSMASTSNKEILERFQSKALRMIVDAPWYVPNTVIWRDLQSPIRHYSSQYNVCLSAHPNDLLVNLMEQPDTWQMICLPDS
jgi:hypothetical protein